MNEKQFEEDVKGYSNKELQTMDEIIRWEVVQRYNKLREAIK